MKVSMFALLFGLTACDLRPAPPPPPVVAAAPAPAAPDASEPVAPAPAPTPTPTTPDAAEPVVVPDAPAEPAPSEKCVAVTNKIATILIAATEDPTQRAAIEQDRPALVRRMAEACTRDAWPDAAIACFQGATTAEQIQACGTQIAPPQ